MYAKASHLFYYLGSKALTKGIYEAKGKSSSYCSSIFEGSWSRCQDLIFFTNLGDCQSTIQFSATVLVVTDAFSVGLPSVIYTDAEVSLLLLKT
ncbi:hypothetical protein HETIRDRAFT_324677 [Heterobasidion irregulare TC 32-1]|uniref:Uncharacterized protein n=1 Tax=Heterobasidion irregulare (strain TC 32-1) TaxID=747525 RepID=W4K061_HETIT|nr:uncharacterized protein HETIRDRAFT_324677 [Heterobasidion irregulare TC 32-1]ETW78725.1 hypothetical protein HETIRDRAFT_324677 [Heterobasidion irregulare TC 32-1]